MNPYRNLDEAAAEAARQAEEKRKRRAELSMFGVRQMPNGEWKPILEKEETSPCRKCRGYGTYGNPLCGAVYNCEHCKGSGVDPDPTTLPAPKPEPIPVPTVTASPTPTFWQRVAGWFGGGE